jgi:hypothetical protein
MEEEIKLQAEDQWVVSKLVQVLHKKFATAAREKSFLDHKPEIHWGVNEAEVAIIFLGAIMAGASPNPIMGPIQEEARPTQYSTQRARMDFQCRDCSGHCPPRTRSTDGNCPPPSGIGVDHSVTPRELEDLSGF